MFPVIELWLFPVIGGALAGVTALLIGAVPLLASQVRAMRRLSRDVEDLDDRLTRTQRRQASAQGVAARQTDRDLDQEAAAILAAAPGPAQGPRLLGRR